MNFWRFSDVGIDPETIVNGRYDIGLVILSFMVASFAGYSALDIRERLHTAEQQSAKGFWLFLGSFCMGSGVWAMHFIGMLAFTLPMPVNFSLVTTLVSMLPAIFASGITLEVLSRAEPHFFRLNILGLLMAGGIGTMHYTGMEAMHMPMEIRYDIGLFVLSILVAHVLATGAFFFQFRLDKEKWDSQIMARLGGGLILGAAVTCMHYTAMSAASFYPTDMKSMSTEILFSSSTMSLSLFAIVLFLVVISIGCTWMDRRLEKALTEVRTLEGLLPICASCKKIRNDDDQWQSVESYIGQRTEVHFSHGICPECSKRLYPEFQTDTSK